MSNCDRLLIFFSLIIKSDLNIIAIFFPEIFLHITIANNIAIFFRKFFLYTTIFYNPIKKHIMHLLYKFFSGNFIYRTVPA